MHPHPPLQDGGIDRQRPQLVGLGVVVALGLVWVQQARADEGIELGAYERKALRQVLAELEVEVDRAPEGKPVASVRAINLDIFAEDERGWNLLNVLHRTTRSSIIERESLLQPGDLYQRSLARETQRNLRDPRVTGLAMVVPLARDDGQVDVLIITRDLWSLRPNSDFEYQDGTLSQLILAPTESNLFGWRKEVGFRFEMDQGSMLLGPHYRDPNIAGSRLQLTAFAGAIMGRDQQGLEGSASELRFEYPLWSLARRWGAFVHGTHRAYTEREFVGSEIDTYDVPETAEIEQVPWEFDRLDVAIRSAVMHQVGEHLKHRFTLGHELDLVRPTLPDGLSGQIATGFARDVMPREERDSAVFLGYRIFTAGYRIYRNVNSFEFAEERQTGLYAESEVAVGPEQLGSLRRFARGSVALGFHQPIGRNAWWQTAASASSRWESDGLLSKEVTASSFIASPVVLDTARLIGRFELIVREDDAANQRVLIGGEQALRGYPIGHSSGETGYVGNIEIRTLSTEINVVRAGAVAFWDAGGAADRVADLPFLHDVGIGLRLLIPQLGTAPLRIDYAVPIEGASAQFPGRFTLGLGQAFF